MYFITPYTYLYKSALCPFVGCPNVLKKLRRREGERTKYRRGRGEKEKGKKKQERGAA